MISLTFMVWSWKVACSWVWNVFFILCYLKISNQVCSSAQVTQWVPKYPPPPLTTDFIMDIATTDFIMDTAKREMCMQFETFMSEGMMRCMVASPWFHHVHLPQTHGISNTIESKCFVLQTTATIRILWKIRI